jgi:hypothetical protein
LEILWPAEALPMTQEFCADFASFLLNDVTWTQLLVCFFQPQRVPAALKGFKDIF